MIAKTRGNTTEFVRSRLLDDLRKGNFQPGDKLTTETLARSYEVSRTPVREALVRLEREGMLEMDVNTGFRVRVLSLPELCELYEIREALEGLAVAKLAERGASSELLGELRRCCEQRRNAASFKEKKEGDQRFHMLICDSCGSKALQTLIHNYLLLSTVFNVTDYLLQNRRFINRRDIHHEHEEIVSAIEEGNSSRARKLLAAHIATARKSLEKLMKKQS